MQDSNLVSWDDVLARLEEIVQLSPEPFDPATLANALNLAAACRDSCRVPDGVGKGYWPTFQLSWQALEVEVFESRFELYRFADKKTEITYFEHVPGEPMPAALMDALLLSLKLPD